MKYYKATAPNGEAIEGTYEMVPGVAACTFYRGEDGEMTYDHDGGTEMFWDGALTQQVADGPKKGQTLFLCSKGEEWTVDQLTFVEVDA